MTKPSSIILLYLSAILLLSCQSNTVEPDETTDTSYQLDNPTIWSLSSTPEQFSESVLINDLTGIDPQATSLAAVETQEVAD